MDIIFLGHSSFKLSGKSASVVTDPYDSSMVGLKFPKVSAGIVTVSHAHDDHKKHELVSDVKRVVDGPGEYEINGVSIIGISSFHDDKKGELRGKNTIYVIEMDGVRLLHLGDLGHKLSEKVLREIGEIDVLMIPVGGEYTIDNHGAAEVVRNIEPKIIIPMHYQMKGLNPKTFSKLTDYKHFVSDLGLKVEETNKFSVKSGSLLMGDQMIVILSKKN